MRYSPTLLIYIGRQYLMTFATVLFLFLFVILLADTLELMRRVAAKPDVRLSDVLEMALFNLPYLGQRTFPFAAMFASMLVFWRLTRHHELIVVRALGISAWQFLAPAFIIAFVLGIVQVTVVDPLAASFQARFKRAEAALIGRQASALALSASGLWLRQPGPSGQAVVHARQVTFVDGMMELKGVSIFNFHGLDRFSDRIDAARARLEPGVWRLGEARVLAPERPVRAEAEMRIPTDLTMERIRESFAPPETISFWKLPEFIDSLEATGFSALGHRLHFHVLLATPLAMSAMVVLGAVFSLRRSRSGGVALVVAGGVVAGFVMHVVSDLVHAIGLAGQVPIPLAAWTPSIVALLLAATAVLYLEDG